MNKSEDCIDLNEGTLDLLTRLRTHGPMTRSEIGAATGWARPTVNRRIEELATIGLVRPSAVPSSTGGRPAQGFTFDPSCACILAVDIATTITTVALCGLSAQPIATHTLDCGAESDPDEALAQICATADALLGAQPSQRLCAVSIAVTSRVESATGALIQAPVMRQWERRDLRGHFSERYHVPAFIENDANARALCKAYQLAASSASVNSDRSMPMINDLLYVHAGMGLGAGIVSSGVIMHGAFGGAGDIGHIHVFGDVGADQPCRCGNLGCVEATAGGWAVLQALQHDGKQAHTLADVIDLAAHGDVETVQLIRQAGRLIGDVVSACVNLLNPSCIVVGGELSHCGELLMSGIRERVWARTQPLATTSLRIESCDDEAQAGIGGLAHVAIDQGLTSLDFLQRFAAQPAAGI